MRGEHRPPGAPLGSQSSALRYDDAEVRAAGSSWLFFAPGRHLQVSREAVLVPSDGRVYSLLRLYPCVHLLAGIWVVFGIWLW